MNARSIGAGIALVAAAAVATSLLASQDNQSKPPGKVTEPPQHDMTREQMKEMEAWQNYAKPGLPHMQLHKFAGSWNIVAREFDGENVVRESKGTSEFKMTMGGRFLVETVEAEGFAGQTFQGRGTMAYDNIKKKYVSTWYDNMGTGIAYAEGTADEQGTVFTMDVDMPDPVNQRYKNTREVFRMTGADSIIAEHFDTRNGKSVKVFEVSYSRKE
jgi:hypothetical protein